MRTILLNPGPVSLSEQVRKAAISADLCHREPEFFDLQDALRTGLNAVYGCDDGEWSPVLLGGSGTTAMEAMISSMIPRDGRLLILENGVYGERLARIAELHGIENDSVKRGWLEAWDLSAVQAALQKGSYTHVTAVHHETTTGRLNPVSELAELCADWNAELLLDSVSSFGAESIPFTSTALSACAATANKCLHGIPGLCFVLARRSALENGASEPRSLYQDLVNWSGHQDRRSTPFTPAVHAMLALRQALLELGEQGGWQARHARYGNLAGSVAKTLKKQGVDPFLSAAESSCVLRSYRMPGNSDYTSIHDGLKQRGFVIYAGQGNLSEQMFRISTMGEISNYDLQRLETALESVFSSQG
jgi:2-aminoethylphosphonate-pyruvate transaminase